MVDVKSLSNSMEVSQPLTRQSTAISLPPRKHMPWIKSPLHPDAPRPSRGSRDRLERCTSNSSDTPIFRENHETPTIELFYDLFFVANLATFTANHEIENPQGEQIT